MLALSVMKITLNYARDFTVLPAFYTGFTAIQSVPVQALESV